MVEKLISYVVNWKHEKGIKPCNEVEFINLFLEFISTIDLDFTFNGDGAYFGKQITICRDNGYRCGYDELTFEIAYHSTKIVIYDGNNNGFWVPEYACILSSDTRFQEIKDAIFSLIKKHIGIE